jgi:hypothetical protein
MSIMFDNAVVTGDKFSAGILHVSVLSTQTPRTKATVAKSLEKDSVTRWIIFLKALKSKQYFLYWRQWFLIFLHLRCLEQHFLSSCLLLCKHLQNMVILPKSTSESIPSPPPPPRTRLAATHRDCEPQFSLWKCRQSIIHLLWKVIQ